MIEVWTDGSTRPFKISKKKYDKVGHSGIGIIIKKDGVLIHKVSKYVGILDNNQTEYEAFIHALQIVLDMEEKHVKFNSDSNMLVKQMLDKYGAYADSIVPYYMKSKKLLSFIPSYEIKLIPREENKEADDLASKALDRMEINQ